MIKLFKPYVNWRSILNVIRVLRSGQLAEGPEVKKFEQEFGKKFKVKNVVALNSGTSALELAYELAGIGKDDEVITPVLTCTATNIPLLRRGAKIVFGDINNNLNLDIEDVKSKITSRTKAIVFVHFGGDGRGLKEISRLAKEKHITLIEDAAQSLGGKSFGFGDFTCVSLQAIKAITAGDGGVLICRRKSDYEKARRLRWFGYDREQKQKLGDTDLKEMGYKYHMSDVSASIARGNLAVIDKIRSHAEDLMSVYSECKELIPAPWATKGVLPLGYEFVKEYLKDICEVGQYHYRNDKYSIFSKFKNNCPNMDRLERHYFILPMGMHVKVKHASEIVQRIWRMMNLLK